MASYLTSGQVAPRARTIEISKYILSHPMKAALKHEAKEVPAELKGYCTLRAKRVPELQWEIKKEMAAKLEEHLALRSKRRPRGRGETKEVAAQLEEYFAGLSKRKPELHLGIEEKMFRAYLKRMPELSMPRMLAFYSLYREAEPRKRVHPAAISLPVPKNGEIAARKARLALFEYIGPVGIALAILGGAVFAYGLFAGLVSVAVAGLGPWAVLAVDVLTRRGKKARETNFETSTPLLRHYLRGASSR